MGKWGKWGKEERGIGEMGNEGPGARANEGMRTAVRGKEGRGKGKGDRRRSPPVRHFLAVVSAPSAFSHGPYLSIFWHLLKDGKRWASHLSYLLASFAIFCKMAKDAKRYER